MESQNKKTSEPFKVNQVKGNFEEYKDKYICIHPLCSNDWDYGKLKDVKNIRVIKRDYIKTRYPNDYFDGIFALESVSYAPNKKELIEEINRILKPGGKLVIIDGFRKNIPNNSIIKKIYDFHCKNRGGADLPEIDNFIKLLYKIGFEDIYIKNISKNIRRHFLILFIDRFPYIITKFLKISLKGRIKFIENFNNYFRGIEIFDFFFGLIKICFYYSYIIVLWIINKLKKFIGIIYVDLRGKSKNQE